MITIEAVDGSGETITKVSAEKGGFNVKSMADAMYRLRAVKPGFKDCEIEKAVTSAELAIAIFKLEKR